MQETADFTDEDSTSSEEDEEAELLTEDIEKKFFKVLNQVKNKDPELYKEDVKYFQNDTKTHSEDPSQNKKKRLQNKKTNYHDVNKESGGSDNFWTSKKLSKDDQFLRDYILNKKFLGGEDIDMEVELRKLKEEEKELEEEAIFEYKFNNRYEEPPDEEFARKYPHALGRINEDIDKIGSKGMHKGTIKGSGSKCNPEKTKIKKQENRSKRKIDDVLVETQPRKVLKNKKILNLDLANAYENGVVSMNNNPSKKVKKKHTDRKIVKHVDIIATKKFSHTLAKVADGVDDKSGCKEIQHKLMTNGSSSKSSPGENGIRKKKNLNNNKRSPIDALLAKKSKNTKEPKLMKNLDLTDNHENVSVSANNTPSKMVKKPHSNLIATQIAKKLNINETNKKKEIKIKNKDYNKLPIKGNTLGKLGNVKLKKNSRYKIRRKKSVSTALIPKLENTESIKPLYKKSLMNHNDSLYIKQNNKIERKKVALKNTADNNEKLAKGKNEKPTGEQETINNEKKKRKRSHKKRSQKSISIGVNLQNNKVKVE